ncbi:MAG: RidA family protein [Pseudomonadota bacterium]
MAKLISHTPDGVRAPFARYAHGIEIPAEYRIIRTSGQLGIGTDDTIPEDARAQADICFEAVRLILAEGGMGPGDVAHITGYVTDRADMAGYMAARDVFTSGVEHLPASTLLIVSGFTRPEFKVEVEVVAAAP